LKGFENLNKSQKKKRGGKQTNDKTKDNLCATIHIIDQNPLW